MQVAPLLLGLLAGTVLPVQAGINAALTANWARSPVLASGVSFAVGTLALVLCLAFARTPVPSPEATSWWHWTGGLLGAFFVVAMTYLAPRLGAVTSVVLVIAGQLLMATLLDHFGALGYPQRPFDLLRGLGLVLVVIGVLLVRR